MLDVGGSSGALSSGEERLAAFDAVAREIAALAMPAYRAADGWLERTRAGLVALLRALDERPEAARALLIDSIAWGPEVLERRGELLEALAQALEPRRGEREPTDQLPETTAENLVGASLSWIQKRLRAEGGPLVELAASLMCMIVHPYLGSEAAQRELERPLTELGAEVAGRGADAPGREGGGPVSRASSVRS
ncbi:MAG TPA: hypothetical protein VK691_07535 [Solirubrobacteraceae bacterium]|jgi:hypothetical protein|nr:hypothetical protein [Solirubrobacteraceae bacterium]